jgi:PAS domain S-box-containing protein
MSPGEHERRADGARVDGRSGESATADERTETIRVLHVDDEPSFADLTAEFLERDDDRFEVCTETRAHAGLERLANERIDCVVSDYEMPEMDGLEFLRAVREADEEVPFILFTGRGSEAVASDAIAAGVTDYLQKGAGTDQYTVLANRIGNAVEQARSRRALSASQERLSLFIDQSPLGVIEWNGEFEVVRVNDAAQEILGYDEATLRGGSWERIVPEEDAADVGNAVSDLLADEGGYHSVNRNVRADGSEVICEWHNRVVTDDQGNVVAVFSQFQDVTERRERRRAIEDLHESTRDLVGAPSREAVAEITIDAASNILDMPINAVYVHDEDADALVPLADSEAARATLGEPPVFDAGSALAWEAFESGEPLLYDDVSEVAERYNDETEVRSEVIVPLGEHGVLIAGTTAPDTFDDTDVALARVLASAAEEALSRFDREASLRQSRERYRTLVENFPDGGVFLVDDDLRYLLAGGDEIAALGLSSDSIVGSTVSEVVPDDIASEQEPHFRAALDGERRVFEQTYGGEHYRITAVPLGDADVDTAMVVSQNVTERKERLRKLRTLIDTLPGMVYRCRCEPGWPMEDVRGNVEELTGYTAEALESVDGIWGEEVLLDGERDRLWETVQEAVAADESFEVTYRIETRDGDVRWMWERGRAVRSEGETVALEGFITDITDREEATERLESFIAAASDVLMIVDEEGQFREVSSSIERVTGHDPADLEGGSVGDYVHEDDLPAVREAYEAMDDAADTTTERVQYRFRSADGDWQWLESVATDRRQTTLDGYVVTTRDVTERRERRRELERRNERLDAFASVVSHDLRNPLSVAQGYLEMLRADRDDDRLAEVGGALDRMERIIDDLLALAREDDVEAGAIDLSTLADEAWRTVDTAAATLTVADAPSIRADPARTTRLLENLFRNSVEHGSTSSRAEPDDSVEHGSTSSRTESDDSVEHGSTSSRTESDDSVEHGTETRPADGDESVEPHAGACSDLAVEVGPLEDGEGFYVADDGTGLGTELRERVFESGYTTDEDGLGLGLSIVERIADAHGWRVAAVESADGGARFEFRGVETV